MTLFQGLTPAEAAHRLRWHMEASGPGTEELRYAAAWACSVLPLHGAERREFLNALGLVERPTPQGTTTLTWRNDPDPKEDGHHGD